MQTYPTHSFYFHWCRSQLHSFNVSDNMCQYSNEFTAFYVRASMFINQFLNTQILLHVWIKTWMINPRDFFRMRWFALLCSIPPSAMLFFFICSTYGPFGVVFVSKNVLKYYLTSANSLSSHFVLVPLFFFLLCTLYSASESSASLVIVFPGADCSSVSDFSSISSASFRSDFSLPLTCSIGKEL